MEPVLCNLKIQKIKLFLGGIKSLLGTLKAKKQAVLALFEEKEHI